MQISGQDGASGSGDSGRRRRATAVEVDWRDLIRELEEVDGHGAPSLAKIESQRVLSTPAAGHAAPTGVDLKEAAREPSAAAPKATLSLEGAADALEELARTTALFSRYGHQGGSGSGGARGSISGKGKMVRGSRANRSGWATAADAAVAPLIDALLSAVKKATDAQSSVLAAQRSPQRPKQEEAGPTVRQRFSSWVRGDSLW